MTARILIWRPGSLKDGICVLKDIRGVYDLFEINDGISRAADWPDDVTISMDPRFPKDLGLADSLDADYVVISKRVKELLESAEIANVEFLPVKIVNHKGRVASRDYFILNSLEIVDCLDREASQVKTSPINPETITQCAQLVIRENDVPASIKLFRPKFWTSRLLVRKELVDRMNGAGLTGIRTIDPAVYTGIQ